MAAHLNRNRSARRLDRNLFPNRYMSVMLRPAGFNAYVLTVPSALTKHLQLGTWFLPELTEEGILFRYIGEQVVVEKEIVVPEWAKRSKWPSDKSEGQETVEP